MPQSKKTKNGRSKSAPKANKKKTSTAGAVGSHVGNVLGSKFGPTGSKVGGAIGNLAGNFFSKLFGKGDYTGFDVERNSLVIPRHADSVPQIGNDQGVIRVRHREFVDDVYGSVAFSNRAIVISPMNFALFPWLGTFAECFEQYRIMGMIIEYKATSATANLSTPAMGSVALATIYNVAQDNFASKRECLNHYFACSAAPYRDLIHPIECKDMYDPAKLYYIRTGQENPAAYRDSRLEDYGTLNIVTQGMPASYIIGELWVSYDVMLVKPRIRSGAGVTFVDPNPIGVESLNTVTHVPEWVPLVCPMHPVGAALPSISEEKDAELPPPPVLTRQNAVVS